MLLTRGLQACSARRVERLLPVFLILLLVGCGVSKTTELPPLSDVRYDFKGAVVGQMTLADFKAAHPSEDEYTSKDHSPELKGNWIDLQFQFNPETREPTFAGVPADVTYSFKNDLLIGILIVPTRRRDVATGPQPVDPIDALKGKFGEPRKVRTQGKPPALFTADWESLHSCAGYYAPSARIGIFDKSHPNAREETYSNVFAGN